MKSDMYTKAVLTVIAACLLWLCLRGVDLVAPAAAESAEEAIGSSGVQKVELVVWKENIKRYHPVNRYNPLPVIQQ